MHYIKLLLRKKELRVRFSLQILGVKDRVCSGTVRKTSHFDDFHINLISKRNRLLAIPKIAVNFNRGQENLISIRTIKHRLQESDLHGSRATNELFLRSAN